MTCRAYVAFKDVDGIRIIFIDALTSKEAEDRAHDLYGIRRKDIVSSGYTGVDDGFVTAPLINI